jgi:DNA-binding beta-propeller fold protein YncE
MRRIFKGLAFTAVMMLASSSLADPIGLTVNDIDKHLYRIGLFNGTATDVGPTGFDDLEGLAIDPTSGILYAVDDTTETLVTINQMTGAATAVGSLAPETSYDSGLAFNAAGRLIMSNEDHAGKTHFYDVNKVTGSATWLSQSYVQSIDGIASIAGVWYGASANTDMIYEFDPDTGSTTSIFDLSTMMAELDGEVGGGAEGNSLFFIDDFGDAIEYDVVTKSLYLLPFINSAFEFEGLAVVPEPTAVVGLASLAGFGLLFGWRRRRNTKK